MACKARPTVSHLEPRARAASIGHANFFSREAIALRVEGMNEDLLGENQGRCRGRT